MLLGEWATDNNGLLLSILKRPTFAGISEAEFRVSAAKPGVVLLLDGWNELDDRACERARVQICKLKAELPELGIVISTRKQALDVPFGGTRVDLLPLGDEQQMAIARAMRGESGERLVDQAWRTEGVRELVTIPLYLTALLSLPEDTPFPTTKEEVIRRFVAKHELDAAHAAALRTFTGGFHQDYLDGLAVFATTTANTSVADSNARKTISETMRVLVTDGQLAFVTVQPDAVLDTLVCNHVLVRSSETPGYSFQHQQFQEWYASHEVERLMLLAIADPVVCGRLKSNVLNHRPWTEAILFAVERTARGDAAQKAACSAAILAALDVDPIFAANMIFSATDDVWRPISTTIRAFVEQWHAPGKLDRAVRFMITSGRPEFRSLLWPLLTHENDQIHLGALRAGSRFRPSVLGSNVADRIAALPPEIRKNILHEIAANSGMDGLDLATALAKSDDDAEVKALVVDALLFRRADHHIADLLRNADEATFDILAKEGQVDNIRDNNVRKGLEAARERQKLAGQTPRERLSALLHAQGREGLDAEVVDLVAALDIDRNGGSERHLLYQVRQRYPEALANGLLRRVREGRQLFYGADDILAAASFSLEDEELLKVALEAADKFDDRAEAASSVLGPQAVGKIVDAYLDASKRQLDASGKYDRVASDRCLSLRQRIAHSPGSSLVSALQVRADSATNDEVAVLAQLLCRDNNSGDERARPFNEVDLAAIGGLARKWGERLLRAGNADRSQLSSIATLIAHAPSVTLLSLLKRLLDDNLCRYCSFRDMAKASGWRDRAIVQEAQRSHTGEYQRAFIAIRSPETDAMMGEYLIDENFGAMAAGVLGMHWSEVNEPNNDKMPVSGVDFSGVDARRASRAANPSESCKEADVIFAAVEKLVATGATEEQKRLAVSLGTIGARLPHNKRGAIIDTLIEFAPRRARAVLLQSLILSGEDIDIKLITDGITETVEAAKKDTWILHDSDAYQLQEWLRLLPFATPVSEVPAIVLALPEAQRNPRVLSEMVRGLGDTPADDAELVLFKLAEDDPRYYLDYQWRTTAIRLGTTTSARLLIDLTASGALAGKSSDQFHWRSELAGVISTNPEIRPYVRELLKDGPTNAGLALLALAVAENPDTDDLLVLVECETEAARSFINWRSIEFVVTERVPYKDWQGAYNVVPVPAVELREKLLALTGGRCAAAATRCLNVVDKIRDEHGAPETEPRHPDLGSGRPWPILTPDPDAVGAN